MRILKNIMIAIIAIITLNVTITTASSLEDLEINCSEDLVYMTLEIPQLDFVRDIQLIQSTFDAPVTIQIAGDEGIIVDVEIDGEAVRISSDGINARISSDGINALRVGDEENGLIRSDGINARIDDGGTGLIRSDGINARTVTVRQSGTTIFSETL